MSSMREKIPQTHFKALLQADVTQGRRGKHKDIVTIILKDLDMLSHGSALKIPVKDSAESRQK